MNLPDNETVLHFDEGIIGVPRARRFRLLERPGSCVRILQSLDIQGFCLPVVDPRLADATYQPQLAPRISAALKCEPADPVVFLAVAALEPEGAVANLKAPVVVNARSRLAAQVILDDAAFPLRARVTEE